jgi:hypothetical protein
MKDSYSKYMNIEIEKVRARTKKMILIIYKRRMMSTLLIIK